MSRLRLPDERLPDGPYRLRILHAAPGRSRAGQPTVRVRFEVASGGYAGRCFTLSYSLLPQAVWRLRRLCAAVGVSLTAGDLDLADLSSALIDADLHGSPTLDGPVLYDLEHERSAVAAPP
jgi:hypothetical protein